MEVMGMLSILDARSSLVKPSVNKNELPHTMRTKGGVEGVQLK